MLAAFSCRQTVNLGACFFSALHAHLLSVNRYPVSDPRQYCIIYGHAKGESTESRAERAKEQPLKCADSREM